MVVQPPRMHCKTNCTRGRNSLQFVICVGNCGIQISAKSSSKPVKPVMTTSSKAEILKDVVAFVDVWSSDKRANFSRPFIQQLQEMGAQVAKRFNKQVTHVVFKSGRPTTWRKAQKSDVQIVSVLWVHRCYEDAVHADEELYPAENDESNPVLKNKRHRCMLPRDCPVRTPENDKRLKKKLDNMMKDLASLQPVATDLSSILTDKENGILSNPSMKWSEYMAQRLKDKRENLSSTDIKSDDDDSSASVAERGYSPDKEERRTPLDVEDQEHIEHPPMKDCTEPWLSPCRDIPMRIPSLEGKKDEKGNKKRSRKSSVRKKPTDKRISFDFSENPCLDKRPSNMKDQETSQSQNVASRPSPKKAERLKMTAAKSFADTEPYIYHDTVKSASCSSTTAVIYDAAETSNEPAAASLQKVQLKSPKQAASSFSALVRSFSLSTESKNVAAASADRDDDDDDDDSDVFEDFFSPHNHQRSKIQLFPDLPVGRSSPIPFDLEPVPTKRKQSRCASLESESSLKKKRKLEGRHRGKNANQQFDASCEPQSLQQQDVKESLPALDSTSADVTLTTTRKRQSTLVFPRTSKAASETINLKQASPLNHLSELAEDDSVPDPQKNCESNVVCEASESRGNEYTVAAGCTEILPDAEETHNKPVSLSPHKMVNKTKVMRTLVMTSMPTEKQHTVAQVVKALGGFSLVDRVCESTTHVVCGEHRRTVNVLLGIARGCWILSFEWILWCLEQRHWVPEEPYELSDQFPSAQICRLQRHLSAGEHQQDLFQGQPAMFVSQHSQPPTQSLVELIGLCGGTVCKTVRQAGICVGRYSGRRPEGCRILSEQWVLDSITHLKRLPYDNYYLE